MTHRTAGSLTPADVGSAIHVPIRPVHGRGIITRVVIATNQVSVAIHRDGTDDYLGLPHDEPIVVTPQDYPA